MAVEPGREAGHRERALRRARAARPTARCVIIAVQAAQTRSGRAAKRTGLLRAAVRPRPSESDGMIGIFEAHRYLRDVGVGKIAVALRVGNLRRRWTTCRCRAIHHFDFFRCRHAHCERAGAGNLEKLARGLHACFRRRFLRGRFPGGISFSRL